MHTVLLYIAIGWTALLFAVSVPLAVRAKSTTTRIMVLDTLSLLLIALMALFSRLTQSPYYLEAALLLALVAFIATLGAVEYDSQGKLFS